MNKCLYFNTIFHVLVLISITKTIILNFYFRVTHLHTKNVIKSHIYVTKLILILIYFLKHSKTYINEAMRRSISNEKNVLLIWITSRKLLPNVYLLTFYVYSKSNYRCRKFWRFLKNSSCGTWQCTGWLGNAVFSQTSLHTPTSYHLFHYA